MTLCYLLVGYIPGKPPTTPVVFETLKEANKAGNFNLGIWCKWEHFTVIPVAIPDEDDLSLM